MGSPSGGSDDVDDGRLFEGVRFVLAGFEPAAESQVHLIWPPLLPIELLDKPLQELTEIVVAVPVRYGAARRRRRRAVGQRVHPRRRVGTPLREFSSSVWWLC
jgi:hypothetical protein